VFAFTEVELGAAAWAALSGNRIGTHLTLTAQLLMGGTQHAC
jgi:hypothetical protein